MKRIKKTKETLSKSFDAEILEAHMSGDNPLALVLQAHLHTENVVLHLLENAASNPNYLNVDRMKFLAKVEICIAFGYLPPDLLPAAKCLNTIRNKFAHNLNSKLTDDLKQTLYNSLPKFVKEIALEGRDRKKRYRRIIDIPFGFLLEIVVTLFEVQRKGFVEMKEQERAAKEDLRKALDESNARMVGRKALSSDK